MSSSTSYSSVFFKHQQAGSARSAEVVVPIVNAHFHPRSVVDVGCGVGGWLKAFSDAGANDILGLDGPYVDPQFLKIPRESFRAADLTKLRELERRFDLACSLEVAEHLPEECARQFVALLVKAAPVVMFSAAVPYQGGTDHINEQWQSYWCALFEMHGYVAVDCVRPQIFGDARVDWWYRQNILIYCEPDRCPAGHSPIKDKYSLDRVDPAVLRFTQHPESGRKAVKVATNSLYTLARSAARRFGLS
jgi:SAM-dependent methyltransferase